MTAPIDMLFVKKTNVAEMIELFNAIWKILSFKLLK